MRFSSATVLVVVAALASSISATPMNTNVEHCKVVCVHDYSCDTCGPLGGFCVSISSFPELHDSPAYQVFPICYGLVSRISAFTKAVGTDARVIA
ncbi:hypothetical protein P692DRAFT_20729164 [Suillus brevipes Sb2]|nr:hypothetical protein P692DRAFT_20729164 [Suillus brevipes Sb2]